MNRKGMQVFHNGTQRVEMSNAGFQKCKRVALFYTIPKIGIVLNFTGWLKMLHFGSA